MNNKMVEEKIEKLKEACKKQHMRVTNQRIEILKEVASSTSHPDAEAIFEAVKSKLPNISIDTVYRTLASLEDLNMIFRVDNQDLNMIFRVDNQLPKARFDADKTPHHHFICTQCGEVFDVFISEQDKIKIPQQAFELGTIKDANLQIRGVCNKCNGKKKEN